MFTVYTSPNGSFGTVNEMLFKVAHASKYAPYGLIAFELSGQADGGSEEGTYAEFGVGPSWPLGGGGATIGVPLKLGFSLSDYYEANGEDNGVRLLRRGRTGDRAVLECADEVRVVERPRRRELPRTGRWHEVVQREGRTPEGSQIIASVGIGMSY